MQRTTLHALSQTFGPEYAKIKNLVFREFDHRGTTLAGLTDNGDIIAPIGNWFYGPYQSWSMLVQKLQLSKTVLPLDLKASCSSGKYTDQILPIEQLDAHYQKIKPPTIKYASDTPEELLKYGLKAGNQKTVILANQKIRENPGRKIVTVVATKPKNTYTKSELYCAQDNSIYSYLLAEITTSPELIAYFLSKEQPELAAELWNKLDLGEKKQLDNWVKEATGKPWLTANIKDGLAKLALYDKEIEPLEIGKIDPEAASALTEMVLPFVHTTEPIDSIHIRTAIKCGANLTPILWKALQEQNLNWAKLLWELDTLTLDWERLVDLPSVSFAFVVDKSKNAANWGLQHEKALKALSMSTLLKEKGEHGKILLWSGVKGWWKNKDNMSNTQTIVSHNPELEVELLKFMRTTKELLTEYPEKKMEAEIDLA